jgi:hypothetical protein
MVEPDVEADEEAEEALELRKEALTMALYVTICLLAALSVVAEHGEGAQADTFKIVWGTTLGLALAHWFAFRSRPASSPRGRCAARTRRPPWRSWPAPPR